MLKRQLKNIGFAVLFVVMFNLLDFVFDRVISHTGFTFDSLSNIILPFVPRYKRESSKQSHKLFLTRRCRTLPTEHAVQSRIGCSVMLEHCRVGGLVTKLLLYG